MLECASLPHEAARFEETPDTPQKYHYPAFAGWSGERYLKKLLRQILPGALYRTWEIFADHQAQGNDCYLGVTHLAEIAGRHTRTVEKNLASLCAKHLLVERAERKVFRNAAGRPQSRVVVVKDFGGLYALAQDYHEWLQDAAYIAPDRDMMALLIQEPQLVARVRRFENYRRLLVQQRAKPANHQREEDRWFTEYQPGDLLLEPLIKDVGHERRGSIPAYVSANNRTTPSARDSLKRTTESAMVDQSPGDSVESVCSSLPCSLQDREAAVPRLSVAGDAVEEQTADGRAEPVGEGATRFEQEHQPFQGTESHAHVAQACVSSISAISPQLADLDLADSFLVAIAGSFGDRNPKGTRTRVRTLLHGANIVHPADVVRCLVRAYLVARETRTIRAEHIHPRTGQINRIPLFCAMVQRLVEQHQWDDDGLPLEEEIAADGCLAAWWSKHTCQIGPLSQMRADEQDVAHQQAEDAEVARGSDAVASWVQCSSRRVRLSQTDVQREARAARARLVRSSLVRMALPIRDASVLWEHLTCGCPLYHRPHGREVCALCFPDPTWPEEVMALLRSIVEGEEESETHEAVPQSWQDASTGEEREPGPGWTDRDAAYDQALRVLAALTSQAPHVEVFLEVIGDCSQIVVRGVADEELICICPEQVAFLIEQAQEGMLSWIRSE